MKRREVILTKPETGERIVCDTVKEAARTLCCSTGQIAMAMSRNGTCHGWRVEGGAVRTAVQENGKTNICFDCKKACGGCSWSEIDPKTGKPRFEPIEGWKAKPNKLLGGISAGKRYYVSTYEISECPLFEPDEPRNADHRQLSEIQSQEFLDNIESILRRWANG